VVHRARLIAAGVDASEIDALESSVDSRLDEAVERARGLAAPAVTTLFDFVARARPVRPEPPALPVDGPVYRTMDAIRGALEAELESDERVFLAGIDIGEGGNVFGLTRGLRERFGDRVRDTPISETAIVGLGVGAAMAGMRPVVEVMYLDFLGVCLDQLLNQAAKLPFMTGGSAEMALTVRTQFGAGRSSGSQHSQSLEALLAHIPGLSVVMPSTPADTYGLLRAAIADPNPVVFVENRLLRDEGAGAAARLPPAHRAFGRRPRRLRHHGRLGLAHGARGTRSRRGPARRGDLGGGDRKSVV
jgi:2-oxoisovalerate dehydrogenase E1 component